MDRVWKASKREHKAETNLKLLLTMLPEEGMRLWFGRNQDLVFQHFIHFLGLL